MKIADRIIKQITIFFTTLICLAGSLAGIVPCSASAKTKSLDTFIYSPDAISATGNSIFLYDEYLQEIQAYDISSKQIVKSLSMPNYFYMTTQNELIFIVQKSINILTSNEEINLLAYKFSYNDETDEYSFDLQFSKDILTFFTEKDNSFIELNKLDIIYTNNNYYLFGLYSRIISETDAEPFGILKLEIIISDPITYNYDRYYPRGDSLIPEDKEIYAKNDFIQIVAKSDEDLYLVKDKVIYSVDKEDVINKVTIKTKISDGKFSDVKITKNGNIIFILEEEDNSKIATLTNNNINVLCIGKFNSINSYDKKTYYIVNKNDCKVYYLKLNTTEIGLESELTELIYNSPIKIENSHSGSNLILKTVIQEAKLYKNPYDMTEMIIIPKDSRVGILKEEDPEQFKGYTYILFSTSNPAKNYYGFVESHLLKDYNLTQIEKVIYANKNANIYKYPSLVNDATNPIIESITAKCAITQIVEENCAIYTTTNNITMYKVELKSGKIGYISSTEVGTPSPNLNERISTNCKTTKDVIVYEDEQGNSPTAINLTKGYRVYVPGRLEYNREYTLVRFNDASGNEIQGYVQTSALLKDGLTTLQIVGIILLSINIIFLFIIIGVKKKIIKD